MKTARIIKTPDVTKKNRLVFMFPSSCLVLPTCFLPPLLLCLSALAPWEAQRNLVLVPGMVTLPHC